MEAVLREAESTLGSVKTDLPASLCIAAMRADDLLMHHLLRSGMDPNESDNHRRTPLVRKLIVPPMPYKSVIHLIFTVLTDRWLFVSVILST